MKKIKTEIYETKDLDYSIKSNFKKNILNDFGYNWTTISNVNLDYEIRENYPDIYIDFKKLIKIEIEYNKETENYIVNSFELENIAELESYIKNLPLDEFDNTLKNFKIYKESLKGKSNKKIIRENLELKEGDLLNSNWGYDQTNIEFFIIKRVLGKNYIIIQEVGRDYKETNFMAGNCKATLNELNKLPKKAFVDNGGHVSVSETGYKRSLSLTDLEKEHYTSSYA